MHELIRLRKELDEEIERAKDIISTRPGMSHADFIGMQASIRAFRTVRDNIDQRIKEGQDGDE